MRLQALRLNGFKTFASPTRIEFSRGMTALVGANGSGKSNLVDAIRWVLGEQSIRDLRGRRAEDVIFTGSSERRPSAMAEVTVNFENDDHWLPVDASEVEVARRIFRSGDSEYLINRQRMRLRDVNDMLRAAGLVGAGHTIIGQGLVDAVLSARGVERYGLVSAVAGVAAYESRRGEALQRLQETRDNLSGARVVLTELEPRLRLLRRQANIVQNADRARRDLETALARYYADKRDRYDAEQDEMSKHLARSEHESENLRSAIDRREQTIATQRSALEAARRRREQVERAVFEAEYELRHSRERERELKAALTEADRRSAELRLQIEILTARASSEGERVQEQESVVAALSQDIATVEKSLHDIEERRSAVEQQAAHHAREHERVRRALADAQRIAAGHRDEIDRRERHVMELRRSIQTVTQRLVDRERDAADVSASIERAAATVRSAREEFERAETALASCTETAVAARTHYTESQGLQAARVHSLGTARREFNDLITARSMTAAGRRSTPVIQTLRFEEGYAGAVAAAVGAISDLDSRPEGNAPGPRPAPTPPSEWRASVASALSTGGVAWQGWLGDLVACDDESSDVRPLLDTTVVVDCTEDLDRAWELVAPLDGLPVGYSPLRLVSDDGRTRGAGYVVSTPGEVIAAARREAAIDDLRRRLPELEIACETARATVEQAQAAQHQADQALAASEADVRRARQSRATAEAELESQQTRLAALRIEIESHKAARALRRIELDEAEQAAAEARAQRSAAETLLRTRKDEASAAAIRLDEIRQALAAEDRARADAENAIQLLTRRLELERSENARRQWHRRLIDEEAQQIRERLAAIATQHTELEPAVADASATVLRREAALQRARIELDSLEPEESSHDRSGESEELEMKRLRSDLERVLSDQERVRSRIGYVGAERTRLAEDCRADLGCDLTQLKASAEGPIPTDLEIRRLRVRSEQAGELEPGIVIEYAELVARRDALAAQVADLEAAGTALEEIVQLADREVKRRFRQAFTAVGEAFVDQFRSMFNGGTAELVLGDHEDSRSVDIFAQPPRKRSRDLSALSGGERTLTASAFLFALIRTYPPPFCILDEVDAALDESNVDRYTQALRDLAEDTQFVLVTHNRATMAAADCLYGITLGSDATSRVLSVRLSELAS